MSFLTHFDQIARGVIDFADLTFYVSLIIFWLFVTTIVIELKKAS
jgi:ABC-2 type transport system permease protein